MQHVYLMISDNTEDNEMQKDEKKWLNRTTNVVENAKTRNKINR